MAEDAGGIGIVVFLCAGIAAMWGHFAHSLRTGLGVRLASVRVEVPCDWSDSWIIKDEERATAEIPGLQTASRELSD